MNKELISVLALGVLCAAAARVRADDGWDHALFRLTEDNDIGFSDRHYTQGAYFEFLSEDYTNQNWLTHYVPSVGYDVVRWKWGMEAGQQMFTPEDISARRLIVTDRPYAGWLYGGLLYQSRGETDLGTPVMETLRLQASVVGPESQADDTQIRWHHFWGFPRPNGWSHQLKTELGFQLDYDRRYRFSIGHPFSLQFLPEGGVDLGNIRTDAHLGGTVRAGYNIPNEFGLSDSKRGLGFGFYIFGGVYGRAVLVDIFLDGNHFSESHHVHREPLVGEGHVGIALACRYLEISIMHVQRSREFTRQDHSDAYSSLTLTMKF